MQTATCAADGTADAVGAAHAPRAPRWSCHNALHEGATAHNPTMHGCALHECGGSAAARGPHAHRTPAAPSQQRHSRHARPLVCAAHGMQHGAHHNACHLHAGAAITTTVTAVNHGSI